MNLFLVWMPPGAIERIGTWDIHTYNIEKLLIIIISVIIRFLICSRSVDRGLISD